MAPLAGKAQDYVGEHLFALVVELGESAIPVIMQMGYWGEDISTFD